MMELTQQVVNGTLTGDMRVAVQRLQAEVSAMPQYEPKTKHYFHAGMYCREVWRHAGVLVVGRVHKKEHFYVIAQGTVLITTDEMVDRITGPAVLMCKPGTKRAVYSETEALCMTFHVTDAKTVEEAEIDLVEDDPTSMYDAGNRLKSPAQEVLQ
jgi:hypothetical protein